MVYKPTFTYLGGPILWGNNIFPPSSRIVVMKFMNEHPFKCEYTTHGGYIDIQGKDQNLGGMYSWVGIKTIIQPNFRSKLDFVVKSCLNHNLCSWNYSSCLTHRVCPQFCRWNQLFGLKKRWFCSSVAGESDVWLLQSYPLGNVHITLLEHHHTFNGWIN